MSRIVALVLVVACLGLIGYDGQLVFDRLGGSGYPQLNLWKIAAAGVIQVFALGFATWYALLLIRTERSSSQISRNISLRSKLLPFVVPVVLSMLAVTLLEIGLFCGEQVFPSVRGRSVCPRP
jgi:hypothetical protein